MRSVFDKKRLVAQFREDPVAVEKAIQIAISSDQPQAWRAAWVLKELIEPNDARMIDHLDQMVSILIDRPDGHQRELLHLIDRFELSDEQEGILFETCIEIWKHAGKSSSVRYNAFKKLVEVVKRYPELVSEISYLTDEEYLSTLSPAIKRNVIKMIASLDYLKKR